MGGQTDFNDATFIIGDLYFKLRQRELLIEQMRQELDTRAARITTLEAQLAPELVNATNGVMEFDTQERAGENVS